jgi:hypothetical protein
MCSTTSLIDDGLDTLRESPRNVDPELFSTGSIFYTFKYDISLGAWLNKFKVDKVSNFSTMTKVSRGAINFVGIQRLVIESPPLNRIKEAVALDSSGYMLVNQSNINKRIFKNFGGKSVNGAEIALERSLASFDGEVVVGESMVAVYALMLKRPKYRVTVYLARENVSNLISLIELIKSRDFAELRIC